MKHFQLKDVFTSFNLFCVLLSLILLFEGKFVLGSYLLVFTIFILDMIDGFVARKLGGGNEFGKEFDTIVDYCSCCVAPPLFIYVAYRDYSQSLAAFTAFIPFFFGTLRGIQHKIEGIEVKNYFVGLPRTMTGLLSLAIINSSFLKTHSLYIIGTILILLFCSMNLSHALYMGNDKKTITFSFKIKAYLVAAAIAQIALTAVGLFWEGLFILIGCYAIQPYVLKTGKNRLALMGQA